MSDDITADFSLPARQQRQILTEIGSIRDDLAVLTAVAMRRDGTLAALLVEVRAMHSQHGVLANRVREIEARQEVRDLTVTLRRHFIQPQKRDQRPPHGQHHRFIEPPEHGPDPLDG